MRLTLDSNVLVHTLFGGEHRHFLLDLLDPANAKLIDLALPPQEA